LKNEFVLIFKTTKFRIEMTDKYASRSNVVTRRVTLDTWIRDELATLPCHSPDSWFMTWATSHPSFVATRVERVGIVLTGWKPRYEGCKGGFYKSVVLANTENLELISDETYLRTRLTEEANSETRSSDFFFPLSNVNDLSTTSALAHFAGRLAGYSPYNPDNPIIAWMNVFQSLVFQLTQPYSHQVIHQLLHIIQLVARGIDQIKAMDPTAQRMLSDLRHDESAQDMLQRSCSGLLGGHPITQLERLRMTEIALKRTFKFHNLLHSDVEAVHGIFAILSVVPVIIGMIRGAISVDKAADHILRRQSQLVGRVDEAGEWELVCKDKRRKKANELLLRDATLLDNLARDGGIPANIDAWAEMILYCQRTNSAGHRVTLSKPADLASLGFRIE
jgi:hypothetical protein